MKKFLIGLFVGLAFSVTLGQTLDDIDFTPVPSLMVGTTPDVPDTEFRPVIFVDDTSTIPATYVHIANFDAQCLTGGKNCKIPLKVYRVQ